MLRWMIACTAFAASSVAAQAKHVHHVSAPEIDASAGLTAMAILAAVALIVRDRMKD